MRNRLLLLFLACLSVFFVSSCAVNQLASTGGGTGGTGLPELTGVFVSSNGNDTNSGSSRSEPLRSLTAAVSNAAANGLTNIYVAQGIYYPGSGLDSAGNGVVLTNSGWNVSGGWDDNFSSVSGQTVLDGTNGLEHVVLMANVSNFVFQGFMIQNGYATGALTANSNGGGMYLTNLVSCLVTNTVVSSNYSHRNGAGIWFSGVSNEFHVAVRNNQCNTGSYFGLGGGIFVGTGSYYNTFRAVVSYNTATTGGGMQFFTNSGMNTVYGTNDHNSATYSSYHYGGGGICVSNSVSNLIDCAINANSTSGSGGGILIIGNANSVTGTVSSNSALQGGGITIENGNGIVINATVKDNSCVNNGGGIDFERGSVTISGFVIRNTAVNYGGGIYNWSGGGSALTNVVIANNVKSAVSGYGGGVYDQAGTFNTNGALIYNNTPSDYVH